MPESLIDGWFKGLAVGSAAEKWASFFPEGTAGSHWKCIEPKAILCAPLASPAHDFVSFVPSLMSMCMNVGQRECIN